MAGANLPITLLVLGGGAAMVWTGIANPKDGLVGEVGRVLRGEKSDAFAKQTSAPHASDLASAILAYNTGSGGSTAGAPTGGTADVSFASGSVLAVAKSCEGIPYVYGGGNSSGPTGGGFDCSGLTQFCYKKGAGIDIPRVAATQQAKANRISSSEARPGDLVFFGAPAYHVGIVLGGGTMIHAPHTGTVVREEPISNVKPGPVTYGRYAKAVSV